MSLCLPPLPHPRGSKPAQYPASQAKRPRSMGARSKIARPPAFQGHHPGHPLFRRALLVRQCQGPNLLLEPAHRPLGEREPSEVNAVPQEVHLFRQLIHTGLLGLHLEVFCGQGGFHRPSRLIGLLSRGTLHHQIICIPRQYPRLPTIRSNSAKYTFAKQRRHRAPLRDAYLVLSGGLPQHTRPNHRAHQPQDTSIGDAHGQPVHDPPPTNRVEEARHVCLYDPCPSGLRLVSHPLHG